MRTTIDLPDPLRARLLDLAARRGEKGFSGLVSEAVARYLDDLDRDKTTRDRAVDALGTLDPAEADEMHESVKRVREHWR